MTTTTTTAEPKKPSVSVLIGAVILAFTAIVVGTYVMLSILHPESKIEVDPAYTILLTPSLTALVVLLLNKSSEGDTSDATKSAQSQPQTTGTEKTDVTDPTTTKSAPSKPRENPYASLYEPLKAKLLEYTDLDRFPADGVTWSMVLERSYGECKVSVHKHTGKPFCFRIVAEMQGSPEETFDLLSDIHLRPKWDDLCEGSGVAEVMGPGEKVQWMYSKGFWPTAPRDALVIGFNRKLEDGRYMAVTTSVESSVGFKPRKGAVRMNAEVAGHIVSADPSGRPN
ncbi:hypothetical protein HDU76_013628, partial [Blyttiomyces sp. JEL0837]